MYITVLHELLSRVKGSPSGLTAILFYGTHSGHSLLEKLLQSTPVVLEGRGAYDPVHGLAVLENN